MKKVSLFSIVIGLWALLFVSCGSQFEKASVSVNLGNDVLNKAFPDANLISRAAEEENTEEKYTATLTVTGDYTDTQEKDFTKNKDVSFVLEELDAGIKINIALTLSYNDVVLYSGENKDIIVEAGDNRIDMILHSTGEYNPFTQAVITYSTDYSEVEAQTVKKGYILTESDLPELEYEGKIFDGWYIDDVEVEEGYEITENVTLTAKWSDVVVEPEPEPEPETVKYKVTYVYGYEDKTEVKEYETGYVLISADFPELAEVEGKTFDGWYVTADDTETKVEADKYTVTADVTITAKWSDEVVEPEPEPEPEIVKYKVTYVYGYEDKTEVKEYETGYVLTNADFPELAEVEGKTFDGWYVTADGTETKVEADKYTVTADVAITAKWSDVVVEPEPETKTLKDDEVPELKFNMASNGYSIENGGRILKYYANQNLVLGVERADINSENVDWSNFQVEAYMGDDSFDVVSLPAQLDVQTMLRKNEASELYAGDYTIQVYITKDGARSENHWDFTFTVVDEEELGITIENPYPEFEITGGALTNNNHSISYEVKTDYENLLDDYEIIWAVNGSEIKNCLTVEITVVQATTEGNALINDTQACTIVRGENTVTCKIISKLVPYTDGVTKTINFPAN